MAVGSCHEPFDLLIMFTKAYITETALEQNKDLIGPKTYLLTLQNGRRTEVDYINGAVVQAAAAHNINMASHEMMVHMVHAMEGCRPIN